MINLMEVLLTCFSVIAIAFLVQVSETLAAAFATAPISSTLALVTWSRDETKTNQELVLFAWRLMKGVLATFVFAVTVWISALQKCSTLTCLLLGYLAWLIAWGILFRINLSTQNEVL